MNQKIPQHVAIVMDGNGRWAETQGLLRIEGHRVGINVVKRVVQACLEKRIATLSLFAFSCENWARPPEEVDFLMQLFIEAIQHELAQLNEHGVCLRFIGERSRLSAALQEHMTAAESLTQNNQALVLNVAVNYSGRWDIVNAMQSIAKAVSENKFHSSAIDERMMEAHLSTKGISDPDLLIRTSGEKRISNFFLWQLAYSEIYFTDLRWPEFTLDEFEKALTDYASRERRYGLISQQLQENQHV